MRRSPSEEWREIPGFPGYFASNTGKVRGRRGWILRPRDMVGGYLRVNLYKGRTMHSVKISVAVCLAFHGPAPSDGQRWLVAHENDIKTDDRPENLYWATYQRNGMDAVRNSRIPVGEGAWCGSKLTWEDVREIRRLCEEGVKHAEIGDRYEIDKTYVSAIWRNKNWKRENDPANAG
ncbi:HNH endonuclease [Arthrobacter phage Wollypog]|uniref:HNH endonuclease n=1 Tax=Arthrobacter phage Wollypog TaxID=2790985 RepID=A0A7T3KCJ0_9CAUD|nr:HNH endonuclease [Arthrobacter phage Wollypog]QPX62610.1 HNH endonuclease [Arthrobacter phage Wollypog]